MKKETVQEKMANTCDEIDIAKGEVDYKEYQLRKNLEDIDFILKKMRKIRKVKSCLIYLKLNWLNDNQNENQLKLAEKHLKDCSILYEKTILKRKILKAQFKQAQRKLAKKLKRIKDFDEKYFPKKN